MTTPRRVPAQRDGTAGPVPDGFERYWRDGFGQLKLSEHFGVSRHQVRLWLRDLGLTSQDRSTIAPSQRVEPSHPDPDAERDRPARRAIGRHRPDRDWPPTREDLADLITEATVREIALRFEVGRNSVRYWLKKYQLPNPRPSRERGGGQLERIQPPPTAELAQRYLLDRASAEQLAAEYEVSPQTMGKWLAEAGIERFTDNHVNSLPAREYLASRLGPLPSQEGARNSPTG